MISWHDFHGPNGGYVQELYERYLLDPESVDMATRELFTHWQPPGVPHIPADTSQPGDLHKIVGAVRLCQAIREYGHLGAQLDPLGSLPPGDPSLQWGFHGITEDDLLNLPASLVGGPIAHSSSNALKAIQTLRETYCSMIGYDYDHVRNPEERVWLQEAAESRRFHPGADPNLGHNLLERLSQIEAFEQFLQRTFPTKYRFSIEGLDMLVPMLDDLIAASAETGISNVLIGMAHRGRLNVLAHTMEKPYEQILAEFKDPLRIQELRSAIGWTIGDVKYHKGVSRAVSSPQQSQLVVMMPPNPSHLEFINPVCIGMARAAGSIVDRKGDAEFDPYRTLQIIIHGDAAFPGQGIVSETLNMSQLPGYWTGGTLHIIANNQLGFTTDPLDARSTLYASDLAKGFKIPIVHVNADDPEACIEVVRTAYAYQQHFEKDFLIDLIGYRRYGHNELDEPGFTQPKLYEIIRQQPSVRQQWAGVLLSRGITTAADNEIVLEKYHQHLQTVYNSMAALDEHAATLVEPPPDQPRPGEARRVKTAVSLRRLKAINDGLQAVLSDFTFYSSRLESTIKERREAFKPGEIPTIGWPIAEELAFATILEDGIPIRLTGQDSERGTFSHRHAVLHDRQTGKRFVPLQAIPQAKAAFEIHNSPLSEAAALGFEYGYNVQEPARLVIWEAQYGDFINSAQVIIDEFITSAREKWGQTPSLVLLLPHGWEGAGPDHSSARLERLLGLAALTNIRIANCTTAAQYFHLLRRQAMLLKTDPLPLIIMSPKSLLRHPAVTSYLKELTAGHWFPVIDDALADPSQVTRLVLCSGKFYLDLVSSEYRSKHPEVAIVRIEQLYPFPVPELEALYTKYISLKEIVWAQEEPKNMGAWEFMSWRLERLVNARLPVNYVGRRRSSSPAEGSLSAHKANQTMIIENAFNWKFT